MFMKLVKCSVKVCVVLWGLLSLHQVCLHLPEELLKFSDVNCNDVELPTVPFWVKLPGIHSVPAETHLGLRGDIVQPKLVFTFLLIFSGYKIYQVLIQVVL